MRDFDLAVFVSLLKRPGMYLGKGGLADIEPFLMAYELGSKHECNFHHLLSAHVEEKYGVAMPSEGLVAQIKQAAGSTMPWEDFFRKESQEVLLKESDQNGQNRFQKLLRRKIRDYFAVLPDQISATYYMNLNSLHTLIEEWTGVHLSTVEIRLFQEVRTMLSGEIAKHQVEAFTSRQDLADKISELLKAVVKSMEEED